MSAWTNRIGNRLVAPGVAKGDRLGLLVPHCLEFVPVRHRIWKAGTALIQLAARASGENLGFLLRTSRATTLIHHGTGLPKGVLQIHTTRSHYSITVGVGARKH